MTARSEIASKLWLSVPSNDNAEAKAKAEQMLDAYRTQVLAEAAAELIVFCPDHGDRDTAFIACQCLAAEDLLSKAGTR